MLSTKAFVGSDKTALSVTVFSFGLWGLAHLGLTRTLLLAAWFGRRGLCQFQGQVTNSISYSSHLETKKYLIFLESKLMTPHWGSSCSLPFLQVALSRLSWHSPLTTLCVASGNTETRNRIELLTRPDVNVLVYHLWHFNFWHEVFIQFVDSCPVWGVRT